MLHHTVLFLMCHTTVLCSPHCAMLTTLCYTHHAVLYASHCSESADCGEGVEEPRELAAGSIKSLCYYCAHAVLTLYSHCTHTVLILYSYSYPYCATESREARTGDAILHQRAEVGRVFAHPLLQPFRSAPLREEVRRGGAGVDASSHFRYVASHRGSSYTHRLVYTRIISRTDSLQVRRGTRGRQAVRRDQTVVREGSF
jgi:hypothetical protein